MADEVNSELSGEFQARVDLGELEQALRLIEAVNQHHLAQIEWQRHGNTVQIDPDAVKEWRYVGLSNTAFAEAHLIQS